MKYMLVIHEANLPKNPVSTDLENSTQEWHQQRLPEFEFHREGCAAKVRLLCGL